MNKKVMVGMSGGVDSSAAAKVLLDSGYHVTGVTLRLFSGNDGNISDAKAVCDKLGIEHIVLDLSEDFRSCVMNDFCEKYLDGRTPNPCIECNKHIKFGKMLEYAQSHGYDFIATGHYAFSEYDEASGRYILKRPKDRSKDQTYVLYNLTQNQLAHTFFPLNRYEKSEIRKIAEQAGLVNFDKPDSQDICFVPDGDYAGFIKEFSSADVPEGDFIDKDGKILGRHKGIIHYTIGQRKGLGIALGKPAFVVEKNPASNTVMLGDESDLMKYELTADNVNLISVGEITEPMRVTAKARYNQKEQPATVIRLENGDIRVKFDEPQRAITSGQAVVLYDGDIVVGGGTIKTEDLC